MEVQRKSNDEKLKNILDIDLAIYVILDNARSIKNNNESSYSPDGSMIIEKAKEIAKKDYPNLYQFIALWEENKLKVEIL
jgi:hypothetical protein